MFIRFIAGHLGRRVRKTMRLISIPALMTRGNPSEPQVEQLSIAAFTLPFFLHAGVAELWLYRTRKIVGAKPIPRTM